MSDMTPCDSALVMTVVSSNELTLLLPLNLHFCNRWYRLSSLVFTTIAGIYWLLWPTMVV